MLDFALRVIGVVVFLIFVVILVALAVTEWTNSSVREFVVNHFAAVIGLPTAGVFAFLIVAVFQSITPGPIAFEGFGFKFQGAAGPIIFWVICFLSITVSIRMLWSV